MAFDFHTTVALIADYGEPIFAALRRLRAVEHLFPRMSLLHRDALDVELLFRQNLPAAALGLRLGADPAEVAEYVRIYALGQTLILNNMDRHLDLSSAHSIRDPALLLADVNSTMCLAVTSVLTMVREAAVTPAGVRALPVMASVTAEIVQSMYDNYAGRFDQDVLRNPERLVTWYRESDQSRHLGSGFYSSGVLGLLAFIGARVPDGLVEVLRDMRRLRQRVDELTDLFEDTVTGLVSYPIAMGLGRPGIAADLRKLIDRLWGRSQQIIGSGERDAGRLNLELTRDPELIETYESVLDVLLAGGIMRECHREADVLWERIASNLAEMDACFGVPLTAIIDLKRALLDRVASTDWRDDRPPHTFLEMVEAAGLGEAL
ncbi:hypothetical protein [Micromonospora zhanjiangensis]|uniref:Uncharacterized protein n=1 Tax=Micromonospora zhanjiangensis TaxID=1522057 RepID=A0ABV8KPL9_9ACTN